MKIELGKNYRTRDGRAARVLCVDCKGGQPVVALVVVKPGVEKVFRLESDGKWCWGLDCNLDLIEAPELEFDWSCLPKWEWSIAYNEEGGWVWAEHIFRDRDGWTTVGKYGAIPAQYTPVYHGTEKFPIFQRPTEEEA